MTEPIRVLQVVASLNAGGMENYIMNLYRMVDKSKVQFDFVVHHAAVGLYEDEIHELGGKIYHFTVLDDKNVVKKRVTLAIAFAVFIVVVIAVILLIKPVMSKVQENRTAKVSQETAQEAEEFLKTKYPEVVIEKREMYVKEHKPQENTQYISSKSIDTEYSYASYVFYGTMDTPDAKGDSVIIYMSDSGKSPYYTVKDSTNKDDAKWQMSIVQNKSGNAKTWDYAFKEK